MSIEEQKAIKLESYREARRYLDNAKETLKKARKEGRIYKDVKYVRTAAGTAYCGALIALDAWLRLKEVTSLPRGKKKSIEWYRSEIAKRDKKLLAEMNAVYDSLHISAYYDGNSLADNMEGGLAVTEDIIDRIKPE